MEKPLKFIGANYGLPVEKLIYLENSYTEFAKKQNKELIIWKIDEPTYSIDTNLNNSDYIEIELYIFEPIENRIECVSSQFVNKDCPKF